MCRIKRLSWSVCVTFTVLVGAHIAEGATLRLAGNTTGEDRFLVDDGPPGIVQVHVVLTKGAGFRVNFSAPIPDCFKGAVWMSDEHDQWLIFGDSQTGVVVDFLGGCWPATVHVLTINIYAEGLTDTCCFYDIQADPNEAFGAPVIVNCNGDVEPLATQPIVIGGSDDHIILPPPEDPLPPDGATDQPLNLALDWYAPDCRYWLGVYWNQVYFGTDPDPPFVLQVQGPPFDVGALLANTTYYWRITAYQNGPPGYAESPVWSFTTGNDVPTQRASWGAIKALFR